MRGRRLFSNPVTYVLPGLMIAASHQSFPAKITICPAKLNLTRQIYCTLSMKKSLRLLKIMYVWTIFSPYHKHCTSCCSIYCSSPQCGDQEIVISLCGVGIIVIWYGNLTSYLLEVGLTPITVTLSLTIANQASL